MRLQFDFSHTHLTTSLPSRLRQPAQMHKCQNINGATPPYPKCYRICQVALTPPRIKQKKKHFQLS